MVQRLINVNSFVKRLIAISVLLAVALVLIFSSLSSALVVPGINSLVSTAADGTQANNNSSNPMISADGEFVAFESNATNLVSNDTNGISDIFLKNLRSGSIVRANVSSSGVEANGVSYLRGISETGRYIVFSSSATNLLDGQSAPAGHGYVYDAKLQTTELVTRKSDGSLINTIGYGVKVLGISSDGRYILGTAKHNSLLAPGMTPVTDSSSNPAWRVFSLDRNTGAWQLVDKTLDGVMQEGSESSYPTMSCDGWFVAFKATGTNYVNGVTSGRGLYLADLRSGEPEISLIVETEYQTAWPLPSISCTGNYVLFFAFSDNDLPGVPYSQLTRLYRLTE